MAVPSPETDTEPVSFSVDGEWLAEDLRDLSSAMMDLYAVFAVFPLTREAVERFARELTERVGPGIPVVVSDSAAVSFVDSMSNQLSTALPEGTLSVMRIEIPGNVTLVGLAEPIRQVRGFIKDLWSRNEQENSLAQGRLLRGYLDVEHESGALSEAAEWLAPKAIGAIATLKRLETEGKLVELPAGLA